MDTTNYQKDKVTQWIETIFKDQLTEISVEISGNSEQGDGYSGDVIFATVKGHDLTNDKCIIEKQVVLKCSHERVQNKGIVEIGEAYLNEIFMYDSVFPAFRQFEELRHITDPFDNVPKFYGKFTNSNMEVLVFENLKEIGYDLWNAKEPMPKEYLRSVLQAYAKFHAISIAMQDQEPEKFQALAERSTNIFKTMCRTGAIDFSKIFTTNIDLICDILRDDLDESVIEKWRALKNQNLYSLIEDLENAPGFKVFAHADCWNNNYLFNPPSQIDNNRPKVAILDWQMSWLSTVIADLSHYLFNAISPDDLIHIEHLLTEYHTALSARLEQLGSNCNLYPLETFLQDWKKYCKIGLLYSSTVIKICLTEKDELPEKVDDESSSDIMESLSTKIRNTNALKQRFVPLINYAVEHKLIRS